MSNALVPRSQALVGELVGQDPLIDQRQVAQRMVVTAEKGTAMGGAIGVELAMAPAAIICYAIPFLLAFVWGVALGLCSLLGAGLYGLRCLLHWLGVTALFRRLKAWLWSR